MTTTVDKQKVAQLVTFEPFRGFPEGLKIHVVDRSRLTSLGNQMTAETETSKTILDVDAVAAALPDPQ